MLRAFAYTPDQRAQLLRKFSAMPESQAMTEQRRRITERIKRENAEWEAAQKLWLAENAEPAEVH